MLLESMTMDDHVRIFLRATYRYRSREGVTKTVLVSIFGIGFLCLVPTLHGLWKLLPAVPALILLGIAAEALVRIRAGDVDEIVLSDDGVRIGDTFWAWQDVRWLFAEGSAARPTVELKLLPNSAFGFAVDVPVRPKLTPAQYEELIAELASSVGNRFPNLKLGGYVGVSSDS